MEGKIRNAGERLGYAKLKKEQIDVIDSSVKGNDVFAVLPTGFGKSLFFACLPLIFDCFPENHGRPTIIIVTTPLKSDHEGSSNLIVLLIIVYLNILLNFVGDISI